MPLPHDRIFKFVFGQPERAAELLFLALPPDLSCRLRVGHLQPVKGSFVPPELKESSTDLLFEARGTPSQPGEPSFLIYLLFEHKSAPDPSTVLQLLGYLVSIWRAYRVKGASRLPHVIPIIVYHGSTEWRVPAEFSDYFRGTPPFGPVDSQFRPLLIDLANISGNRLADLSTITQSALAALRYAAARRKGLLEDALPPTVISSAAGESLDYFRGLVTYLLEISTPEAEGAILKIVRTPAAREVIVTIAEKLRYEGTLTDRQGVLIPLVSKKFGLSDEERDLIERTDDLDRLAAALDEILDAETKQQVFDKLS